MTTEGGSSRRPRDRAAGAVERLREPGVSGCLFLDPDPNQIDSAVDMGVEAIELHAGQFALAIQPARGEGTRPNWQSPAGWSSITAGGSTRDMG